MDVTLAGGFLRCFSDLPDPRGVNKVHKLHDLIETRKTWVVNDTTSLGKPLLGLATGSLARIERTRQNLGNLSSGRLGTTERHHCISSLGGCDDQVARIMAVYIRGHWAVKNNLHDSTELVEVWQLDVSFNEDDRRIRKGHGAENFSRLSRIALNLLKRDKTIKAGIKRKRLNAGWDHDYLLKLSQHEHAFVLELRLRSLWHFVSFLLSQYDYRPYFARPRGLSVARG